MEYPDYIVDIKKKVNYFDILEIDITYVNNVIRIHTMNNYTFKVDCEKLTELCHRHGKNVQSECPTCIIPGLPCPKMHAQYNVVCLAITCNHWYETLSMIWKDIKYNSEFKKDQLVAVRMKSESAWTMRRFISNKGEGYMASSFNGTTAYWDECKPAQEVWKGINFGE